jgi:hypothetical protein
MSQNEILHHKFDIDDTAAAALQVVGLLILAELLPGHAANRLKEAYLSLRAEWHRSVLDIPDTERAAQTLARYRDDVSAIWESVFNDG